VHPAAEVPAIGASYGSKGAEMSTKTNHFANTSQTEDELFNMGTVYDQEDIRSSSCLHHHLAFPLPKCVREMRFVVFCDQVVEPRLSTELVYPLRDLVSSGIPKPRKKR